MTYVYECRKCAYWMEINQTHDEEPFTFCPNCELDELKRIIQPIGIQFKGEGFYSTDNT